MRNKITLMSCAFTAIMFMGCRQQPTGSIDIDFTSKGADIPTSMYGIFFEEINHSGDGGLYAELVQNRGFENSSIPQGYTAEGDRLLPPKELTNHLTGAHPQPDLSFRWNTDPIHAWSFKELRGEGAKMELTREKPLHEATPTSLKITIPSQQAQVTVANSGYWGMNIVEGEQYNLRFYARKDASYRGIVTVKLIDENGNMLSSSDITLNGTGDWSDYKLGIIASQSSHKASLELDFEGAGCVWLDYVSLFPEKTFNNHPNGLRADVAQTLQDMHPAFVRWPGGCIVEGITLSNRVQWKQTIGDPMTRPSIYNTWGYHATMGFGYHEFLQFCEDIGAGGMFVCNAGLGCQGRVGDACDESQVQYFIDEALDAIEYAVGEVNTKWGAMRAKNGHPAPFPLKYMEIGNENWGGVYALRYDRFYSAIKAKYPDLILISTLGLGGQSAHKEVDMIDPHWYVAPEMFFMNDRIFDEQPRADYKIYVGEYACNVGVGSGNLLGALGEAAFLTGIERNSDIVTMASYAPLLENVNDRVWPVNLIWFDSYRVMGRSSYHVQKMYAENRPSYNLSTAVTQPSLPVEAAGKIGLGAWDTQAQFKDLKITSDKGEVTQVDFLKADKEWTIKSGEWATKDGMYVQQGSGPRRWAIWENASFDKCTIEFKALKTGGHEGFLLFFGVENEDGYMLNIGGWGNSRTAFEKTGGGGSSMMPFEVAQHIENDRWYEFKVVIENGKFIYYCDGEKMLEADVSRERRYAISGYDSQTGEIIVKVVNAEGVPFVSDVNLGDVKVFGKGKVVTLSSASEMDENTLDNPDKVVPVEKDYNKFGSSFRYSFEPWSFTILRIKVKIE